MEWLASGCAAQAANTFLIGLAGSALWALLRKKLKNPEYRLPVQDSNIVDTF